MVFFLIDLKVQRSFKLKIEAQGRYFERLGQINHSKTINEKTCKPFATKAAPLPSLSEESESLETHQEEEHRSTKKQRIVDESVLSTSFEHASSTPSSEFYNQTWNLSWSQLAAACQSPLVPKFLL